MRPLSAAERQALREQLSIIVRPEVAAFALAMEDKLRKNDHKGGWKDCTKQYMAMRLTQEREELRNAIQRGDPPEQIMKEAADVANFAMMVADIVGGLTPLAPASPSSRRWIIGSMGHAYVERGERRWEDMHVADRNLARAAPGYERRCSGTAAGSEDTGT
jgi:NTP pyrophosphatase (non-canonical NTP hydrolase)